ncbi:glycosyltransferase [Microbacterium sp. CPCC 204701]|uniref:glycosyltransferase n=1 Tax=Microbacterium sp. CPCC 204701 TaxID=2493084 RepID=UPI0013E3E2EC|nr:glycosyltransferase [Microbacterium sp. CPCC 204701]
MPGSLVGDVIVDQEEDIKVLIFTFGTRGDIEPFAALAERVAREGHTAVLAAPEAYRSAVSEPAGFLPMATEMDDVMRDGMASMSGPSQAFTLARRMSAAMKKSLDEQWDAAQQVEPTVIVSHPKALGGLHVAERLGIPMVASLPLPLLTPTAAFPAPFTAGSFPRSVNRASYHLVRFSALAYGGMINRLRREKLGLARMSRFSDYLHAPDGSRVPVLYPFSRHVVPVPADYPASAHVTGYWFRDDPAAAHAPSPQLQAFLAAGGPPIYVGFGSMGFGRGAGSRGRMVMEAVHEAGVRAVVSTGWGALHAESTADVMVVDEVPHGWLFPRVAAVVHHGGSGTTAAGLRAGRPTLVCPVLGDQPFWGRRVHELGAGPEPLPLRRASVGTLAARIRLLVGDSGYAESASRIGEAIEQEDGTARALEVLLEIEAAHLSRRSTV